MNAKEHKVVMDLSDKGWQWDQEIVFSQDRPWKTFLLMLHKRWNDIIAKHKFSAGIQNTYVSLFLTVGISERF